MKFLFLGTGSSMGTPVVTCRCKVCRSQDRRNHRLRPSGLLKVEGKQILFDVGPDFREQALTHEIQSLDGVIITHGHYDHIAGMDDLRVFYYLKRQMLPCLLSQSTFDELKLRSPYFFDTDMDDVAGGPKLQFQVIKTGEELFCNLPFKSISYRQKGMEVKGFRLGKLAYVMDLKEYTPEIFEFLQGTEVIVLSGLRRTPSNAHLTLDEALAFAQKVGVKMAWFSHVAHELDHEETNRVLPPWAQLAYDGLEVSIEC